MIRFSYRVDRSFVRAAPYVEDRLEKQNFRYDHSPREQARTPRSLEGLGLAVQLRDWIDARQWLPSEGLAIPSRPLLPHRTNIPLKIAASVLLPS